MKPFAVHRGTNDVDGKFVKLETPGPKPRRYRVDLWVITGDGDRLRNEIYTKGKVRLNDLLEDHVKPSVDELIAEANSRGGIKQHGFEMYKWG